MLGFDAGTAASAAPGVQPSAWATASPEEMGIDSASLVEMFDYIRQQNVPVHSAQIVRHGRLVLDAYFYPYGAEMRHDVASVTKSITSTLIGLAIEKGFLADVNQPLLSLFPDRSVAALDERKRKITVAHLLAMQAGWDCGFEPKEARLFEMRRSADWLQFMLDLPMVSEPGTRFAYCSGNPHILSILLTRLTGTNAMTFARRELFEPLGIHDVWWPADPRGHNHGWGDLQMHPRDMAKIGQLFLQRGRWGDRQILSDAWIRTATRAHVGRTVNRDHYGYAWWVKGDDYPGMFEAVGRGGQRINVWPAKDLVLVFTGGEFEPGDLARFILKALKSDAPLAANPAVSALLQKRIAGAAIPPSPQPIAHLQTIATRISGRKFNLSTNTLGIRALELNFKNSAEAYAEILWNQERVNCPLGLDGVERFSTNELVNLPQAAKGRWLRDDTFLLELNLVGGINFYRLKLSFAENGETIAVALNERTGLNDELFTGVVAPQ
jgi:CubicO group peptidase (beta-lactamase class C family)